MDNIFLALKIFVEIKKGANINMVGVIAGISGEVLTKKLQGKGYEVALVAGKGNESGTDIANAVCIADLREAAKIIDFLQEYKVKCVLIGTGHRLAIRLSKDLEIAGFILSNNPDASLLAKDKIKYKECLTKNGFDTPAFMKFEKGTVPNTNNIIEIIGLPCVVKSSIDCILPQKANTKEELKKAIDEIIQTQSDILVEEYIAGVDMTIPVLVSENKAEAIMISYYSKAKECHLKGFNVEKDQGIILSKDEEEKVKSYCKDAAIKTGMEGLCRLDAMMTKNGRISILEANSIMVTGVHPNQIEYGRFFLEKEGVDFAEILVNIALEKFRPHLF